MFFSIVSDMLCSVSICFVISRLIMRVVYFVVIVVSVVFWMFICRFIISYRLSIIFNRLFIISRIIGVWVYWMFSS